MSKEQKDRPRQQHYEFVHHALPAIFFNDPEGLLKSVRKNGDEFLNYIWGKLGQNSRQEYDDLSIRSELKKSGKYDLLKIILPKPEHDHEAFAVALIFSDLQCSENRYFVFESRLINNDYVNLIGEWVGENYLELAKLESPNTNRFIEYITTICQTASA